MGLDGHDDCLRVTIAIAGTLVAHSVSIGSILPTGTLRRGGGQNLTARSPMGIRYNGG